MFISIEGVDGSGKTTIAKELSKRLDFIYVEKPFAQVFDDLKINKYLEIKRNLKKLDSRSLSCWFYGMNFIFASEFYSNKNIVYDRGLVSNFSWLLDDKTIEIFELMIKFGRIPTLTIVLDVSEDVLYKRVLMRDGEKSKDLEKIKYADLAIKNMKILLDKFNINNVIIDCSSLDVNEIVDKIIALMRNMKLI